MKNSYLNSVLTFKVYLRMIQKKNKNKNALLINRRKEEK